MDGKAAGNGGEKTHLHVAVQIDTLHAVQVVLVALADFVLEVLDLPGKLFDLVLLTGDS